MNVDFYWSSFDEAPQGRFFLATDVGYATPNALKTVTFDFNSGALGGFLIATVLEQESNTSELAERFLFGEIDLIFKDGFED